MKMYQHTQRGTLILVAMLSAAAIMAIAACFATPLLFLGMLLMLAFAWHFSSLTIEIAEGELRWRFGPGLIRNRVRLADITSVRAVRSWYFEGWGIHWSRFGWLYNVSGCDAVAVRLRNGGGFALGTDQPELLARLLAPQTSQALT